MGFIAALENELEKKAIIKMMPMQSGDVPVTWADTTLLNTMVNYKPTFSVRKGIAEFTKWYKYFYKVS